MALSHLIKYVYNNGTEEVIKRGKRIHQVGFMEMTSHDDLMNSVAFRVKDDMYNTFYRVNINRYADPGVMSVRCTCPYNLSELCRHEAAALMRLQDMLDKHVLQSSALVYDQRHTVAKMKTIDLKMLRMLSSKESYREAESILRHTKANIIKAENDRVEAELIYQGNSFPLVIQKNEERNFDTSCFCNETSHPLCEHKLMLFLQLLNNYGPAYFDTIRNWDREKEKLLQIYGYSLNDDLTGKFEFVYKEGKPFLKVLDPRIKRVAASLPSAAAAPAQAKPLQPAIPLAEPHQDKEVVTETLVKNKKEVKTGVVINLNQNSYPFFTIDFVEGTPDENNSIATGNIEKQDLTRFVDTDSYNDNDRYFFQQVRKLQDNELNKYLNRNSPFSGFWDNIIHQDGSDLPDETKHLINEYIFPKLQKLADDLEDDPNIFLLPKGRKFKTGELIPVRFGEERLKPLFKVTKEGNDLVVNLLATYGIQEISLTENEAETPFFFLKDNRLLLWDKTEDVTQVGAHMQKPLVIDGAAGSNEIEKVLLPLSRNYKIEFDKNLVNTLTSVTPKLKIQLQEKSTHLIVQPVFDYEGIDVLPSSKEEITHFINGSIIKFKRDLEAEEKLLQPVKSLHTGFSEQDDSGGLALTGNEVLKNNWFFLFTDKLRELKIPLYGLEQLKNYRFNTSKPGTQIYLSSGLDWFDAKVQITFGEQKVSVADIKKALSNKQNFVQLGDGTLGILPEEWLKKYSLLFKVGVNQENKLRINKYQLSLIDELYEQRDEEEITFQLDEKFERLKAFKQIPQAEPPASVQHILRPYQKAGYQWLHYLGSVGWGGILADDMGLGKTLQAITVLQGYKDSNDHLQSIVVCPTTLIYNWQNELQKFAPHITYTIHHGNQRSRDPEALKKHEVIITTYGTLRSDIQMLMKIPFDYIILDESQAIKNPSSKVTKSVNLLYGKNKVCMSGTPLQNNTFDIYAQMNFLNPGLLGSVEFFRNEFATPIDKFGEAEQKEHLRKLLYPFILRRTKDQVAKDLPPKTETILYCEMEAEQRKIYEAYRNNYRDKILGEIEEQGIEKSQFSILQGLMKLRQICDSPAILNEEERLPAYSIKLQELERELKENIGEHKVLIFSQFLDMLALIKQKLQHLKIKYEYFDGSTSATGRQQAIQNFQENEECRVFVISLKAGGVGLNLTAADYVYIVDPWWNPAVEQQAIDRTHRIGQDKSIFAYRMICVDTIEDKILKLQERKRSLAKDLISDDSSIVKTLTKEDIEYLFS